MFMSVYPCMNEPSLLKQRNSLSDSVQTPLRADPSQFELALIVFQKISTDFPQATKRDCNTTHRYMVGSSVSSGGRTTRNIPGKCSLVCTLNDRPVIRSIVDLSLIRYHYVASNCEVEREV